MKNVQHIIDHAEKHCSKQGSKLTQKRKQVLSGLLKSNKAVSAYELVDIYKQEFGVALPAMSIYRILDFLVDENLVHKLELANKYIACEHISCGHAHASPQFLICRCCNKVREISINHSTIDELRHTAKDAGFQLSSPQLELSCICQDCSHETH